MKDEKKSELEELKERIQEMQNDYNSFRDGRYALNKDGCRTELFSIMEWSRKRVSDSSRQGHIVAICYDRKEAIFVRNGLRNINENPLIEYEAVSHGDWGDEYHTV